MANNLIDRQTLIDAYCAQCTVDKPETCSTIRYGDKWCTEVYMMQHMPSIDATPVKHGMWKQTVTGWIYCSVCGNEPPGETNSRTDYCPNCGAKMDGDENEK